MAVTDQPKWTPGPWPAKMTGDGKRIEIGTGLVDGPHGYDVAEVYSDDCDQAEAWANAHLIAAAPDLYAALEAAMSEINRMKPTEPLVAVALSARAALAKARGETK